MTTVSTEIADRQRRYLDVNDLAEQLGHDAPGVSALGQRMTVAAMR